MEAPPPVEEPPAIVVTGARPDVAGDVIAGIGSGVADAVIAPPPPPPAPVVGPTPVEAAPPAEEPPVVVVTGARPDAVADAVAGIGGRVIATDIPPSAVTTQPPVEATPPAEEEPVVVVTGARPDVVADAVAGIGGSVITNVATPEPSPQPVEEIPPAEEPQEEIVVTAPEVISPVAPGVTAGIGGVIPGVIPSTPDIVVNAPETTYPEQPSAPVVMPPVDLPQDIVVTGRETTYPEPPAIPLVPVALPGLQTTPVSQPDLLGDVNPEVPDERSILDTALDVADIATTVLPIVGGVVGGGGGGGGTRPPDTSKLTFRPGTLRPTIPGGAGGVGGIGGGYPYTPQTYGRRGGDQETEYLFFTRDPVVGTPVAAPMVPVNAPGRKEGGEIEDDMVKHLVEYHKNGGHHGPGQVKGIGSGQEDKIPAWLSDGEYVWSAQDVADLGDGSTDEGVRRLDKMRQMVRQQAGRKDVKKIAKPQKGIDRMLKAVGGLA